MQKFEWWKLTILGRVERQNPSHYRYCCIRASSMRPGTEYVPRRRSTSDHCLYYLTQNVKLECIPAFCIGTKRTYASCCKPHRHSLTASVICPRHLQINRPKCQILGGTIIVEVGRKLTEEFVTYFLAIEVEHVVREGVQSCIDESNVVVGLSSWRWHWELLQRCPSVYVSSTAKPHDTSLQLFHDDEIRNR